MVTSSVNPASGRVNRVFFQLGGPNSEVKQKIFGLNSAHLYNLAHFLVEIIVQVQRIIDYAVVELPLVGARFKRTVIVESFP